jgi:hypothetical protein
MGVERVMAIETVDVRIIQCECHEEKLWVRWMSATASPCQAHSMHRCLTAKGTEGGAFHAGRVAGGPLDVDHPVTEGAKSFPSIAAGGGWDAETSRCGVEDGSGGIADSGSDVATRRFGVGFSRLIVESSRFGVSFAGLIVPS